MTTTTATRADIDEQAVEEFAGRLFELFTGGDADLPDRDRPPHRPVRRRRRRAGDQRRAGDRAGLAERYVREWLGAMVTGGIVEYEPSSGGTGCRGSTPPA